MIETLFIHWVSKFFQILLDHRDFFEHDAKKRLPWLESLSDSAKHYFSSVSEEQFVSDLNATHSFIKSYKGNVRSVPNGFADAFLLYLLNDVAALADKIPLEFYSLTIEKKIEVLETKFKLPPAFVQAFSAITYQEILNHLCGWIKAYKPETPYIVVQVARDPSAEVKKEIRQEFQKESPFAWPVFQISKQLFGGMRVFVDGKVLDQSWLGKIQRFTTSLTI